MPTEPSAKDRFTSLDTLALVRELRAIVGAHVDKVFDAGDNGVSVLLRGPRTGRSELIVAPGRYAGLTAPAPEHAESLTPLARELRRLLAGATLAGVSDPRGERYLELVLSRGSVAERTIFAVELFGSGNLVVAHGPKIVAVAHAKRWAHREVRRGADYTRPPARDDPWSLGTSRVEAELARSRTDLASTLAARLALGGPVAEEVIARGAWPPDGPAAALAPKIAARLTEILGELVAEIGATPHGYLVRRGGQAVDATPYRSRRWGGVDGVEEVERPSFSEAALDYFRAAAAPTMTPEEKAREAERANLVRLLARQREAADALRSSIADRKADADTLYAHYTDAERQIAAAGPQDRSGGPVRIVVDGRTIEIAPGQGVDAGARGLYEEAKRLSAKLAGAEEALADTERRLRTEPPVESAKRPETAAAPTRLRWFEKYRWFVSSEGAVVIAGRDAASNDVIVRRHLKAGDVYVHADLQGAASVIIKRPDPKSPLTGATLREAAQFAVAFSKAWRAGLVTASAFWAEPDQVSKSAESGEFVAKGAWVVRGTKHFERDVPLELALGVIRYDDDERWTAAPPEAVRARGAVRALLTPGDERDRSSREEELVRDLGIPRSLLQRLLPAGGLSVRRA